MPLSPGVALVPIGDRRFQISGRAPGSLNGDRLRGYAFSTPSSVVSPPQIPTTVQNMFVRKTGSDNNGGSSSGTSPDRTGADGVANGTTTFTAASGSFTQADVNKLINIVTKGRYRITAVGSGTSVTLSGSPSSGSSLTWNLGGACLTIAAILANANGALLGGDRVWIGAGTYREVITLAATPTFELQINGDVDGAQTGDAGEVRWTAYTTDDKTVPSSSPPLNVNSKSNVTLQGLVIVGGTGNPGCISLGTGFQNITFRNCWFGQYGGSGGGSNNLIQGTGVAGQPMNLLIDRCWLVGGTGAGSANGSLQWVFPLHSVDYDVNITIRNTIFLSNIQAIRTSGSGSGSGKAGGIRVYNSVMWGQATCVAIADANFSTSIPMVVTGCKLIGNSTLNANAAGMIVSSNNISWGSTTNVTAGVGDHANSYAAYLHMGQEAVWGGAPRAPFTPVSGSPLLGYNVGGLGSDLLGNPRPAGGASGLTAVGALERGNTPAQATSPAPNQGTHTWQATGPWYQDFVLPVDTTSTTITVDVQRDASYVGPPPALVVLPNAQAGVPALTASDTGATAVNNTITLPAFTATAVGAVTVRILSSDQSGVSVVEFSNITVT